jgi:hypothetical protein
MLAPFNEARAQERAGQRCGATDDASRQHSARVHRTSLA